MKNFPKKTYWIIAVALVGFFAWVFSTRFNLRQEHSGLEQAVEASENGAPRKETFVDYPFGKSNVGDISGSIPELIASTENLAREDREASFIAAMKTLEMYREGTFIRWEPIVIDDILQFTNLDSNTEEPTARETIRLTPFPGSSFTAQNNYFRYYGWGLAWEGEIIQGGNGRVSVQITIDESGESEGNITIISDVGGFIITPTDTFPYYLVIEGNPNDPYTIM